MKQNSSTLSSKPLQFIDITRYYEPTGLNDTASLSINGRAGTPGKMTVIGGLEHCVEIAPKTEADRLAWIRFLESDDCKNAIAKNGA